MSEYFEELPLEVLLGIIRSLDYESIKNLCQTNRLFARYCNDQNSELWMVLLQERFPEVILDITQLIHPPSTPKQTWEILNDTNYWLAILHSIIENREDVEDIRNMRYAILR